MQRREEEESGGAMERQSASASLDSGCRDDPYHPPSCRPGIVTVTVPDSLFLSPPPLSLSLFFSSSALRSTPTSSSAAAAALLRHQHGGPSRRGIFDRAFSFSLFCSFCFYGKDPLRFSVCILRCEMQLLCQISSAMFQFRSSR